MKGSSKTNVPLGRVASKLSELRQRAGLTQRQVAHAIGMSYQPVFMAETYPGAPIETVDKIAEACGATCSERADLRVLSMLDARVIPIPKEATEQQVREALACLGVAK